jgi:RNA recognition motif-containing protein
MGMKLYVGNLAFSTTSKDLQELFEAAGTVESASVVEDRDIGRSRGFGFIEMSSKEEGEASLRQFNSETDISASALKVEAKPREDRSVRGRRYHGRGYGRGIPVEMSVGRGTDRTTQGEVILLGEVTKVENGPMVDDHEASKQAELYFAEIAESRKRSRRTQTEIERLKKKTQAIIDALT